MSDFAVKHGRGVHLLKAGASESKKRKPPKVFPLAQTPTIAQEQPQEESKAPVDQEMTVTVAQEPIYEGKGDHGWAGGYEKSQ